MLECLYGSDNDVVAGFYNAISHGTTRFDRVADFVGIVLMLIDLIKRNFVWILLLIIFVPASVPIFRTIVDGIFYFLRNVLP